MGVVHTPTAISAAITSMIHDLIAHAVIDPTDAVDVTHIAIDLETRIVTARYHTLDDDGRCHTREADWKITPRSGQDVRPAA